MRKGFITQMTLEDGFVIDVFVASDKDIEVKEDAPIVENKMSRDAVLREIMDAKNLIMRNSAKDEVHDATRKLWHLAAEMAWRFLDNE